MENGSSMTPLATLLHATPALTHCNPIQTSSSSRLLLSDDCMCNPSHNMKIGWESRDSHFLLPHPIPVTPTSNKKKSPLNQIVQFLKPQLRSQPQIKVLERGGGHSSERKWSGGDTAINQAWESKSAWCTVPSMDMQLEMHSEELWFSYYAIWTAASSNLTTWLLSDLTMTHSNSK